VRGGPRARLGEAPERVNQGAELQAALREAVLDTGWSRVDHRSFEHARLFEVCQPLNEGGGGDASQSLDELVEPDGASVRDVEY